MSRDNDACKQAAEWLLGMGWKWGDGHWIKPTTPQPQGDAAPQARPFIDMHHGGPIPAPTVDGGACDECEVRGHTVTYVDPYGRGDVSSPEHSPCTECTHPAPAPDVARLVELADSMEQIAMTRGVESPDYRAACHFYGGKLREALAPFTQQGATNGQE